MIKAIIFDCFGVLYGGSLDHLRELTPPENMQDLDDIRIAYDRGFSSLSEYRTQLSALTNKSPDEIEILMQQSHIRNERLVEVLHSLKHQYKIGMLTNVGKGLLDQLFTPPEQDELFDAVVQSGMTGTVKPYPESYEYIAEQLEIEPRYCLMIDDLVVNIEGAKAVGMDGIVYESTVQLTEALQQRGIVGA